MVTGPRALRPCRMDQRDVPVVWSPDTTLHDPVHEVWVGVATPATEVAERVQMIRGRLLAEGHPLVEATADPDPVLAQVHDPDLLEFLRTAADRWRAGPYDDLVGQPLVVPYLFPTPAMTGSLPTHEAVSVHAQAGRFAYDTMTTVGPGTWEAARAAAACAVEAARSVSAGSSRSGGGLAYALCRPPGHHATHGGYGGSCYLNNAAVAAQALRESGIARVAVLDLDAHHGNGTASIFYERGDVLYGSVHVDPGAGWFPHLVGFAEETGRGDGHGTTRNLPLPEASGDEVWLAAVEDLAGWAVDAGCAALVVSLGVDAATEDPESPLLVTEEGFRAGGRLLGSTGLPAVVVQEGGYHLPTLGALVSAYLTGHAETLA